MAVIEIRTTEEEQNRVIEALRDMQKQVIPVATIAAKAGMNPNRVRYVLTDLIEAGKVKRIPYKAFNNHYKRYSYEVIE